jgi:hypothetical protein
LFPEFPAFAGNLKYFLKGKTLNMFRSVLDLQRPVKGAGVELQETNNGILIFANGRGQSTVSSTTAIDFTGTISGTNVLMKGGKVMATSWTGFSANNPASGGWTETGATVADTTLAFIDGDSIWLRINLSPTTINCVGPLATTDTESISITGGAGGGGGGGGGGGAGGRTTDEDGVNGVAGTSGSSGTPGSGGAGGAGGFNTAYEPFQQGGVGGTGGLGEEGDAGLSVGFLQYTKATVRIRYWSVTSASFLKASTTPTSTATQSHMRLLSIVGGNVIQHKVGSVFLTLPSVTFAPPD